MKNMKSCMHIDLTPTPNFPNPVCPRPTVLNTKSIMFYYCSRLAIPLCNISHHCIFSLAGWTILGQSYGLLRCWFCPDRLRPDRDHRSVVVLWRAPLHQRHPYHDRRWLCRFLHVLLVATHVVRCHSRSSLGKYGSVTITEHFFFPASYLLTLIAQIYLENSLLQ